MAFADPAQRQNKADLALGHIDLVGMEYRAGIEQRRSLIGVLLTEICPDQSALRVVASIGSVKTVGHFIEASSEKRIDIPVVLVKRRGDSFQLAGQLRLVEREDEIDRLLRARRAAIEARRIARFERPDHRARRIGPKEQIMKTEPRALGLGGPSYVHE